MKFLNRKDAGQKLGTYLKEIEIKADIVVSLLRGGIVVGQVVAKILNLPQDFLTVRKVGAPGNPEYGVGAITASGTVVLNEGAISNLYLGRDTLQEELQRQKEVANKREAAFRKIYPRRPVIGKSVILVDDGLATGYTVRAAVKEMKQLGAKRVIVAVPVTSQDGGDEVAADCDQFVALRASEYFYAVGQYYNEFDQVEDSEVLTILKEIRNGSSIT